MDSITRNLKPPVIIAAVVAVAIIVMSMALRKTAESPKNDATAAEEFREDLTDRDTTIRTSAAARTSISDSEQSARHVAPGAASKPRKQVTETYEEQLKRSYGDSYISGRVFSRAEEGSQQARPGNDANTSGSRWGGWGGFQPLANARIQLFENDPHTTHPPLRETITDEEGSFTLTQIHNGNRRFVLVAKADGYAPEAEFVTLREEPGQVFVRLQKGVPLKGKVLDSITSQGVAGAKVLYPNDGDEPFAVLGMTTTSITGDYHFDAVPPGRVVTMVSADGYMTARSRLRAPDDQSDIPLVSGGSTIKGVTIDRLTKKPAGGAKVWAEGPNDIRESVLSQADGSFEFKNMPDGEFEVYAIRGMRSESHKIELAEREVRDNIEIILPAELFVTGRVVHARNSSPLPGVKVWYQSPSGRNAATTDADGRFAFDTMAIEEYAIMIHENGFLPVNDKGTTGVVETLERKIASNASSDELLIRLRPVPSIFGKIEGPAGWRGGEDNVQPLSGADVSVSYLQGQNHETLKTRSDAAGNYFINLPERDRGEARVIATKNMAVAAKTTRIPRNQAVDLTLKRTFMMGQLALSDETPLEGVRVDLAHFLPERREADHAVRIQEASVYTRRGGQLFMPLPEDQQVELKFSFPDGVEVSKVFRTNRLLESRPVFVYDPASQDVLADTSRSNREGRGMFGGRGRGGDGRGGENRSGGNRGEGGQQQQGQGNQSGQPAPPAPAASAPGQ